MRRALYGLMAIAWVGCSSEEASPATADPSLEDTSVVAETGADGALAETSEDGTADAATDSGSDGDSTGDAACNSLALEGEVSFVQVAAAAPTLAGGVVADGVYVLSKFVEYTGPGGGTDASTGFRSTLSFTGGSYAVRWSEPGDAEEASVGTFSRDAGSLSLIETCPGAFTATYSFAATPTSVDLLRPTAGGSLVQLTYVKK